MKNKKLIVLHLSVIVILAVLFVSVSVVRWSITFNLPDGYDYLQLARNIAESGRFTTDVISPISWSTVPEIESHPDLWRAPVYPVLLALGFTLAGTGKIIPLAVSVLFFLGFLGLSYWLMFRLAGPRVAFFSTLLLLSYNHLVRTAVTIHPASTYLSLIAVSLLLVLRDRDTPLLFGAVSALAYLTRYNHWFLLAGLLYVALRRSDQSTPRYFGKFAGGFFLLLSPWLLRNVYYTGSPFYHHHMYLLAGRNPLHPNFDIFFQFNPENPFWFAVTHPAIMAKKWIENLFKLYRWIPRYFTVTWPVALLAVWGGLSATGRRHRKIRDLLRIFGIGFVLQALVLAAVHIKARHFIVFLPAVCFLAGFQLNELYRRRRRLTVGLVTLILVINALGWAVTNPWPATVSPDDYRRVSQYVPDGEPILTNAPELTAWFSRRTSLWAVSYPTTQDHYPAFNYVLLTPEVRRDYPSGLSLNQSYLGNKDFRDDFRQIKTFRDSRARLYRRIDRH